MNVIFGVTSPNRRDFFLEKDYVGPTCTICYFSSVCIIYNFHSLFKKNMFISDNLKN